MGKVYVVTAGSYSDYHICGVTQDLDVAKRLKKLNTNEWDDACIEEYELETADDHPGEIVPVYRVVISIDGEVSCVLYKNVIDSDPFDPEFSIDTSETAYSPWTFYAMLKAKDEAHAIKIATDRRAELLSTLLIEQQKSLADPRRNLHRLASSITVSTSSVIASAVQAPEV